MKRSLFERFAKKIDEQLNAEIKAYVEYLENGNTWIRSDLISMEDRIAHLLTIHEMVWSVL